MKEYVLPHNCVFSSASFISFLKKEAVPVDDIMTARLCNSFKILAPLVFEFSPDAEIRFQFKEESQNHITVKITTDMFETNRTQEFINAVSFAKTFDVTRTDDGNILMVLEA